VELATRPTIAVRALEAKDLDAVVAIDAALQRRSRRIYIERRLAAALREPRLHAQFAAVDGDALAGFLLARVLEGEFGNAAPSLRIELVGVRPERQHRGIGRKLLDALNDWGVRHRMREVGTIAAWTDHSMLRWLDAMGFSLSATRGATPPTNRPRLQARRTTACSKRTRPTVSRATAPISGR
jgi:GNAT superfamily N-acetyltransferase